MEQEGNKNAYKRIGKLGVLKLYNALDISSAAELYTLVGGAIGDSKTSELKVILNNVDSMDVTGFQLLYALIRDAQFTKTSFTIEGMDNGLILQLNRIGLQIPSTELEG